MKTPIFLGTRRRRPAPADFFGRAVRVGDTYFYGNPPKLGRVILVKTSTLTLETGADYLGRSTTMNVRSPEQGVCLNRVEEGDLR